MFFNFFGGLDCFDRKQTVTLHPVSRPRRVQLSRDLGELSAMSLTRLGAEIPA